MNRTTVKRMLRNAGTVLSLLILAFAVTVAAVTFVAKAQGKTPRFFGRAFHLVVTGSMEPEIEVGELVVSRTVAFADVEVGDNIVFLCVDLNSSVYGKDVIHKAVRITGEGIWTQGVANSSEDALPVTEANLRGIAVSYSAFWGTILMFLSNPVNWLFMLLLGVLCFVVVRLTRSIARQVKAVRCGEEESDALTTERAKLEAEIRAQYGLPQAGSKSEQDGQTQLETAQADIAKTAKEEAARHRSESPPQAAEAKALESVSANFVQDEEAPPTLDSAESELPAARPTGENSRG